MWQGREALDPVRPLVLDKRHFCVDEIRIGSWDVDARIPAGRSLVLPVIERDEYKKNLLPMQNDLFSSIFFCELLRMVIGQFGFVRVTFKVQCQPRPRPEQWHDRGWGSE